ncbi:phytanoyl-CoA dioxygenase family protein [Alteromonas sp. ASW11-130]|uniref:phytanoyl-CoA dioxygenase family protein n=1 Tax=Alteromonas sp. ASW11-130 TaxID=3015775 RepID=UPI002242218B|nr:phytanoyl-CoA dioxygenase family protein [Alteromonas sp. ASW11-130]MCW8090625.1 phytanoyl-CoA dioxygenase family protein [Alteromonas sp. ASW11-130]
MPHLAQLPLFHALNEKEIRSQFQDDQAMKVALDLKNTGFSILENFVSEERANKIVEECKAHFEKEKGKTTGRLRWQDGWKQSQVIKELAIDKRIIKLLSDVYGKQTFAFQSLNFDQGTQQKLHADTVHFNSYPNHFMAGVWVALEDISEENGAIKYVENSHTLPNIDLFSLNLQHGTPGQGNSHISYPEYEKYIEQLVVKFDMKVKLAKMKKGDALVWASGLLHGGSKVNNPKSSRYSQVTHYFFKDCLYYTPLSSDMFSGKLQLRTPFDIASGKKPKLSSLLKTAKSLNIPRSQVLRSWLWTHYGK